MMEGRLGNAYWRSVEAEGRLQAELDALRAVAEAAKEVTGSLDSDAVFEEMRFVWGNTNTHIWRERIKALAAALANLGAVKG